MARAVGSFGGQQTSGLVGKVQYMPGRHGQVICGRSRAAQKRSGKQLAQSALLPAVARAWGELDEATRKTWVDAYGSASAAYPVYVGSGLRFMHSLIAQGAEPDTSLLAWLTYDAGVYRPFPLGAIVPSWIEGPPAQIGFTVDWTMDYTPVAMVYIAHGLPSRGRPDLAKFRVVGFWTAWGEQGIDAANGGEGVSWIRVASLTPNDYRHIGDRFFRVTPDGYQEF